MPNKDLKDKIYNKGNNDKEKYTALAMQESRLKKAKKNCEDTKDCNEFNRLGGDIELRRLEGIIHTAQNANYQVKKTGMDAGRENQFQKKKNGTEVSVAMVTKSSDHSGPSATNNIMTNDQALQPKKSKKIMTNDEALSEQFNKEISNIRYLIEYMNNNNKKQKL